MTYMTHIAQKNTIDLTLFVPCFNEEENIVATLDTIREAMPELKDIDYEVLVTDDGSHDRTSILVK